MKQEVISLECQLPARQQPMSHSEQVSFYTSSHCKFLPPANEVWGKVMFLHLSVSHSVHRGCTPPEQVVRILLECILVLQTNENKKARKG